MQRGLLFFNCIFFVLINSMHSKQKVSNFNICFNGEKKDITMWINESKGKPTHPFSVTLVYRIVGDDFEEIGDISKLPDKEIERIDSGYYSCSYCGFYELRKTRLSGEAEVAVGALFLEQKVK